MSEEKADVAGVPVVRARWWVGGGVAVVALVGGVVLWWVVRGEPAEVEGSARSPGTSVVAPSESQVDLVGAFGAEVDEYLAGPGSLVVEFRELSEPLVDLHELDSVEARAELCTGVGEVLNASVDPIELYDAAVGVPDGELVELLVNDRSARSSVLVACAAGDAAATDEALEALDAIEALLVEHSEGR